MTKKMLVDSTASLEKKKKTASLELIIPFSLEVNLTRKFIETFSVY